MEMLVNAVISDNACKASRNEHIIDNSNLDDNNPSYINAMKVIENILDK